MMRRLAILILLLAAPVLAQTPPQLDMFGNLTGVACPASASWINTTVSSGAVTGSLTPQNISLANATGVAGANWLTIDAGAAPVQVTGEALGTVATGTAAYPVTLAHGNYLPGTAVLKVGGTIVAYDQGAKTSPALAGQLQTGILTDAGLVTTGTSSGNMAISTGASTDTTPYENFMSVQYADPVPGNVHTAVQEFVNIVFTSAFATAHNGQAITIDYKYSPAEMFVVPSLTGSQINGAVLMNNHAANAPITQGTWYTAKVTVGTTPTWVFCDPLGFGNQQFALYAVGQDSSTSHISLTVNTTVSASVATGTHTVTPASMAGICDQCFLTFDQGTSAEETEKVSVSGGTITATFTNPHSANFTVKGYYYNAVAFGTCVTSSSSCQAGLAGTSGGKYYGNIGFWGPMQVVRLRGWGYGVLQAPLEFGDSRVIPLYTLNGGGTVPWPTADHSQLAKMPYMDTNDVTYYSTWNSGNNAQVSGCGGTGDYAVKNTRTTYNGVSTGANPGNFYPDAFGDLFDPNLYAYLCGSLKTGFLTHENPWQLARQADEGDYLKQFSDVKRTGFTAFDGTYEDYGGRKDLFMPPVISVSVAGNGSIIAFSNKTNNLKAAMIAKLQLEYPASGAEPSCAGAAHGIAALNACWGSGSNYDNFNSDGTAYTGETVASALNATESVSSDSCSAPLAVPSAPTLTQGTGGSLTLGNAYSVAVGYTNAGGGETMLSSVSTITLTGSNNAITVTSPASETGATGYNVYVLGCAAPGPCSGVTSLSTNDAYNVPSTPYTLGTNMQILVDGHTAGHPPYADSTSIATVVFTTSLPGSVAVNDGFVISSTANGSGIFNSSTNGTTPWAINGKASNSVSFSWPVTGNTDNNHGRGFYALSCPSGISSASDTGSGTDTSYNYTLLHLPTRQSVQIFANGTLIGGDLPNGGNGSGALLSTGEITGTATVSAAPINYTNGNVTVTFANKPVSGNLPITASYINCGWGCGHGLADEDGTCPAFPASCATVWGTSSIDIQADGNAAFQADMAMLLGYEVSYFSSNEKTQYRAIFPHTLLASDYAVGGHGVPADPVVYQNYAPNVDIIALSGMDPTIRNTGGVGPQGISPFQYVNYYVGDKPLIFWAGQTAVADSVMAVANCDANGSLATQALRAGVYGTWITQMSVNGTYTGTNTFTGLNTWQFGDNYSECDRGQTGPAYDGGNWGMVSAEDNPYDGVHDTTGTTPEYIGNNPFAPTPELNNYGDLIDPVRIDIVNQENTLLGAAPPPALPTAPTGRQPGFFALAGRFNSLHHNR